MAWATAALIGSACDTATTVSPGCAAASRSIAPRDARLHLGEGLAAREAEAARVALHGPPLRAACRAPSARRRSSRRSRPRAGPAFDLHPQARGPWRSAPRSRGCARAARRTRRRPCACRTAGPRCAAATASACSWPFVGEVQARRPAGQDLAGGGRLAVAHEQDEVGGRWGGRSGHDRQSTYRCRPWIRPGPRPSSRSPRRSSRAGPARASSRGGSRWPRRSGPRSATRSTGAGGVPGFGDPDAPVADRRAWRPPPTAPTAPGGCSPATARATSSTRRCTAPASPTSRRASHRDDGLELDRRVDHGAGAVRAPGQQADARRARHAAGRTSSASSALARRLRVVRAPRRVRATRRLCGILGVRPRPRVRPRRRGAARRRPLDRRQLPREPAEHLHRQAHRAHARRRARPRPDSRRP